MNYQQKNKIKTAKPPLVSIIVPSDSVEVYLDSAIESIKRQTYRNCETIIVDNSKDEDFCKTIKKFKEDNPNILLLSQKNLSFSELKNFGVATSRGKYVVCLRPEDKIDDKYIEKAVKILELENNNKPDFVTSYPLINYSENCAEKTKKIDKTQLLIKNIIHSSSMFKRSCWEEVGGYKKELDCGYDDWDLWLSFVERGYDCVVIKLPLFFSNCIDNIYETGSQNKYNQMINFHKDFCKNNCLEVFNLQSAINDEKDKELGKKCLQCSEERDRVSHEMKRSAELNEELNQIKFSRITGPSIKLRAFVKTTKSRFYLLRYSLYEKIKIGTPNIIKLYIKKFVNYLLQRRTNFVTNKQWQKGLPLITVVTPYYNQGQTVINTIESVLCQTFKNFEYIIVNDGSSEENTIILNKTKLDKRVNIINLEQNIGKGSPAAARNHAIKMARGKYIVCLDADDRLDVTYLEKCVTVLETNPLLGLVTSIAKTFGASDEILPYCDYTPLNLMSNNMVKTSAMFKKEAWEKVGGYKANIGYEDWEFWINLAEHGYFGKLIHEPLFFYMVSENSRYIEDRKKHVANVEKIESLHPNYIKIVKPLWRYYSHHYVFTDSETRYVNLNRSEYFSNVTYDKSNILIVMPWMTFGGAETLVLNFCREVKDNVNIHFITGQKSKNEWEYRFKEISKSIYHLNNLFDSSQNIDFISNYIVSHHINLIHLIHTNFTLDILEKIRLSHPDVKIVITMFNDIVEKYFFPSIMLNGVVDAYTSDNKATADHYKRELPSNSIVKVIPNGIDCYDMFNPSIFNRGSERKKLGINENDLAVFFVGRLSQEKNPDVFVKVAEKVLKSEKHSSVKFYIIGDGIMRPEIEKQINSVGSDNIVYLGYQTEVARYLSAADVFVLPSSIEGFPLSILEAMAMKLAVIASNVGAVSDVINNGADGYIVEPGSVADISRIICELDKNRKRLESIKLSARLKLRKNYSNIILKKNYLSLYEDLLK